MFDPNGMDLVAASLEYPTPQTAAAVRAAAEHWAGDHVALARALWDLAVWLETAPPGQAEERYTMLFDLTPICTLHVGYQVFGDTYQRGAFLANFAPELRKFGVEKGEDLPDFLPLVLRLLGRITPEEAEPLLTFVVHPALVKMIQALTDSKGPWCDVVRALPELLGASTESKVELSAAVIPLHMEEPSHA